MVESIYKQRGRHDEHQKCWVLEMLAISASYCTYTANSIPFHSIQSISLNMSKIRMEWDFRFICLLAFAFQAPWSHKYSAYFYILHARHAIVLGRWSHHARATAINVPWFNLSTPITICDMQIKFWHIFSVCACVFCVVNTLQSTRSVRAMWVCVHDKLNECDADDAIDHWFDPLWRQMHLNNDNNNNNEKANIMRDTLFNTPLSIYYMHVCFIFGWIHFSAAQQISAFSSTNEPTNQPSARPPDRR